MIYTEWFPHQEDPQLGVFVEKHAKAAARNFQVTVLFVHGVSHQDEKIRIQTEGNNPRIIRASYRKSSFRFFNLTRYSKALSEAKKNISDPDLIHLEVVGKNYLGRKMFFRDVPFVITEHWSGYLRSETDTLIGETQTKNAFREASKVSAVSLPLCTSLQKRFGRNDIEIIPNIIETVTAEPRTASNGIRMIMVADLVDEIKNISGVITALKHLPTDKSVELIIVGDGPDRSLLQKKAAEISSEKVSIRFAGRLSNEESLKEIAASDFLIVNSRRETFSMVAAEAIAAGIPVIATRCGGPEQFMHSGNGILIGVDAEKELQEAILFMINNNHTYSSQKMSEEILNKFGMTGVAETLRSFYNKALSHPVT